MSQNVIANQVRLSWSKTIEVALKSLKKRFVRAMITMISVVLAIAFLVSVWTQGAIIDGLRELNDPMINAQLLRNGVDLSLTGLSSKDKWLICLSLMVCAVGILNAMLMSVTERFREIGTMKCLGAMDGFIVRLFIVEAGLQGACGTVAGIVLGFLIGLVTGVLTYGVIAVSSIAWGTVAISAILAYLIGQGLSVVFAIYPAYVAASMQPVEAMRVEE